MMKPFVIRMGELPASDSWVTFTVEDVWHSPDWRTAFNKGIAASVWDAAEPKEKK